MPLKQLYDKLIKSTNITSYDYLAHFFCMLNEKFEPLQEWQIGIYNKEKDRIKTFLIGQIVSGGKEEEVFKKPGATVEKLELGEIKLEFEPAREIAKKFLEKNYPANNPLKIVCLLQCLEGKPVWNFTIITKQFITVNIKINAVTSVIEYQGVIEFFSKKSRFYDDIKDQIV